jgi:hypothetical protein
VVAGTTLEEMKRRFDRHIVRETRFGGLSINCHAWQFDVWPLDRTWTFVQNHDLNPAFSALPRTTFLNLEAVAVDVWPSRIGRRTIFSGDDQFFRGIVERTLEVNNEENPFPALCVVRSLVMAASIDFAIGPRLAAYIADHGSHMSLDELREVQQKHYGVIRFDPNVLKDWIGHVTTARERDERKSLPLPVARQLTFWDENPLAIHRPVLAGKLR